MIRICISLYLIEMMDVQTNEKRMKNVFSTISSLNISEKNLLPNLSFTIILSFSDFTTSTFMVLKRFYIEAEGV
jgi:hypothetical protein